MTNAQKKVNDAREALQKEMDIWGLTVEHGSSCRYVVGAKAVTFSTVARPVKGRKKLIEDLRAAGYEVWTFKAEDKDGKRYMKFRAYKTVKIKTAADDAEEYVEQPTEVKQENDDVNEIYRKNEFAVQVVAKGSFLDSDPGYGGKVYEVETATIRLNHVAMNEWVLAQVMNDRECYDTDEELKPAALTTTRTDFQADNLQNTYEKKLSMTDAEYVAAVDAGTHDFANDCAGFGLCQWTYWSRKKALLDHVKGLGVSIADTEGQLLFVVKEMTASYSSLWQLLKTTTSIKEASDAVLTIYERPADMSDKVKERRAEIGMAFYEEHMNGSMGTVELSDDEMTMEEIQHLLAFLGYYKVKVDGLFGNMTREATEKFQERFGGLAVDGLPGTKTQKALRHAVAYGMPKRDNADEDNDLIPDAPAPSGEWPGKYWSREEFRCRCGGKYCNGFPAEPDHNLVNILDIVRERGGRPGHRSSGLRCEVWNKMQKGVANSKHKTGKAMDFRLEGHTAAQTLAIVRTVPGINYCYDIDGTYVHVDVN